jgi:septum formation protein
VTLSSCWTESVLSREKPSDDVHARELLKCLSGASQQVVTGVVVTLKHPQRDARQTMFTTTTSVRFAHLCDEIIDSYISIGEYSNKAGGYGIQSLGELLIEEVRGSFTNVVGIPLREVSEAIADLIRTL